MVDVQLTDDAPAEWDAFWSADPRATLFLHPRWTRALLRAFPRFKARFLIARSGGSVAGFLPLLESSRRGLRETLSLPHGTHGGPLLSPDLDDESVERVTAALARAFRGRAGGVRSLRFEMTVFDPSPPLRRGLESALADTVQEFRTHVVDLTVGFDALWTGRYFKNTRNCVRMAERAGTTTAWERGDEAVALLARFHAEQATGWEGIAPYSREALQAVCDAYGDDARIYVARVEGEPVAACLDLEEGKAVHPWVSGASAAARKPRAFHHLINTAIREAVERGLERWDFGGSGGHEKVEFFKESFAGEPVPVLRCFQLAGWARKLKRRPAWD